MLGELLAGGRLVDLALGLVLLEFLLLAIRHRRTGRGPAPARLARLLLPGVFLLLALRSALRDEGPLPLAAWLSAALVAHLVDLSRR